MKRLVEFSGPAGSVRLPPRRDVPLSARIIALMDHPVFQRLRRVRQLGPIALIYPGATHTRFEHSLGVYGLTLEYLRALLRDPAAEALSTEDLEACILGGLLHDLGHYPFAHSLEASHIGDIPVPRHEALAEALIFGRVALPGVTGESLATLISRDFQVAPEEVVELISQRASAHASPTRRLVARVISSGMDADKADYLERDALHMGLPFGEQFDRPRLLNALRVHPDGDKLALAAGGRVAAESFIFARYAMFSEGYWHHTARAVAAMVEEALRDHQRRGAALYGDGLTTRLLQQDDEQFLASVGSEAPEGSATHALLGALTHGHRQLYKRVLTLSLAYADVSLRAAYERVYDLSRAELSALRTTLREVVSGWVGRPLKPWELLIDTPPRDKDHVEDVDLIIGGRAQPLMQSSQIVRGVSVDFVKVVKKIRVFVAPEIRDALYASRSSRELQRLLVQSILDFSPSAHAQQKLW